MADESNQKSEGNSATWLVAIVGFVVIYILSPAPVIKALQSTGLLHSSIVVKVFSTVYYPLEWMDQSLPIVKKCYEWWFKFWGVN